MTRLLTPGARRGGHDVRMSQLVRPHQGRLIAGVCAASPTASA